MRGLGVGREGLGRDRWAWAGGQGAEGQSDLCLAGMMRFRPCVGPS